jgi:hypothetical protein
MSTGGNLNFANEIAELDMNSSMILFCLNLLKAFQTAAGIEAIPRAPWSALR